MATKRFGDIARRAEAEVIARKLESYGQEGRTKARNAVETARKA